MAYTLTDLAALQAEGFDTIIDVRTPAEYAEDHLPGAVNMPVLSNQERAEVGTIYTQDSPFKARKIGATRVARNAANAIEAHLLDKPGGWRPLVYCWRGGQRSGSFTSILTQIGWRAQVLEGGYQSWRQHVVAKLYDATLPFRVVRLDGFTGTAKTELLGRAAALGVQVLDLEGLARHRGSILGDIDGVQPAQKGFESAILELLSSFDAAKPILIEAESARIGTLRLPPALWVAMKESPRIVVKAAPEHRARFLAAAYTGLVADADALATRLNHLRAHAGHATVDRWLALLADNQPQALAQALIADHYDPAYARLTRSKLAPPIATIDAGDLMDPALDRAAAAIAATFAPTSATTLTTTPG